MDSKSSPDVLISSKALRAQTAGDTGMDLASAITVTLQDSDVHCLPSDAWGPLGWGCSALVIGQASTTKQGFFVLSRFIDRDFTGEVQIMVWTPVPPSQIVTVQLV